MIFVFVKCVGNWPCFYRATVNNPLNVNRWKTNDVHRGKNFFWWLFPSLHIESRFQWWHVVHNRLAICRNSFLFHWVGWMMIVSEKKTRSSLLFKKVMRHYVEEQQLLCTWCKKKKGLFESRVGARHTYEWTERCCLLCFNLSQETPLGCDRKYNRAVLRLSLKSSLGGPFSLLRRSNSNAGVRCG